jgi:hypothetical protein
VTARRLLGVVMVIAGAAAFAACLRSAYAGMRDVMRTDGGFCASGGPYVIARQCSGGDVRLLLTGILGGLIAAALYTGGTAVLGGSGKPAGLLAWTALFGALGWNFISLGLRPAHGQGSPVGWLVSGVVFWLLALGGLVPAVAAVASDLRNSGRPPPVLAAGQPLVRAIVLPGQPTAGTADYSGWLAGAPDGSVPADGQPTRAGGLALTAGWLVATLAGAGIGLALGGSLVTMLR